MPLGVVSSSANATVVLEAAGIADRFDTVVDGGVATRDGAARQAGSRHVPARGRAAGRTTERVAVIEDAVSGVRAAAAGGFGLVIGVDRGAGEDTLREAGAEIVVTDLAELAPSEGRAMTSGGSGRSDGARPFPDRRRGPGRDELPPRRPRCHRDGLRGRQRLPRHARQPRGGPPVHAHGTFVNGFHETWPIHHAEPAFGFARTGQTIVNVPDIKVMKLYVDDEPLMLGARGPRALRAPARLP